MMSEDDEAEALARSGTDRPSRPSPDGVTRKPAWAPPRSATSRIDGIALDEQNALVHPPHPDGREWFESPLEEPC